MPEAVISNSTSMSEGQNKRAKRCAPEGVPAYLTPQPFKALPEHIQRDFHAVEEMLKAHATMVAVTMESGEDFSLYANGVHLNFRLILNRLGEVVENADAYVGQLEGARHLDGRADKELLERIGQMVAAAYFEAGYDMNIDYMADWNNYIAKLYASTTSRYHKELISKLEGDTHLLTVGNLLPWLELKIRNEIVADETDTPKPEDLDAAYVSQAMSKLNHG